MEKLFVLGVFFLFFSSCKEDIDYCAYDGCDVRRETIKVAKAVKGRISTLDSKHPDQWVIVSEEGIIGQDSPIFDGPDIVVACNMPDNFKEYGLKVVFSAELKNACGDFKPSNSKIYNATLTQSPATSNLDLVADTKPYYLGNMASSRGLDRKAVNNDFVPIPTLLPYWRSHTLCAHTLLSDYLAHSSGFVAGWGSLKICFCQQFVCSLNKVISWGDVRCSCY